MESHKVHPNRIIFENRNDSSSVDFIFPEEEKALSIKERNEKEVAQVVASVFPSSSVESSDQLIRRLSIEYALLKITEEKRSLVNESGKIRLRNARDVEKNYAPKLLAELYGFNDIRSLNGRPVDIEAWKDGVRYHIDVKYYKKFPSILEGS